MIFLMRRLRRLVAAGLVLAGLATAALAEARLAIEQYALPNGLTVILAPMAGARRVAVVTRYDVGSADEAPGRSGFAHLFEHLMFEGTQAVPDFDAAAAQIGAEQNAFTEWDATTYYLAGAPEVLPKFLRLEADRMANLANAVSGEDLANQRDIVRNEMRENTLDSPGTAAYTQAEADLAPPSHPYGHSTIGSIADLEAATLDDVRAFHRTHYLPGNASLTITGAFDPATIKPLIDQTYGLVPAGPVPPPAAGEIGRRAARVVDFTDAVETPTVTLLWNGPLAGTADDQRAAILAYALSSDAGPLYVDLVDRQKLATRVWLSWEGRRLGGVLSFQAKAAPGVTAAQLAAAMETAFTAAATQGLTADRLAAAAQMVAAGYDQAIVDPTSLAFILEATEAETGDARNWHAMAEMAATMTPQDALDSLALFARPADVTVRVSPGPRNEVLPPVLTQSTGTPQAQVFTPRPEVVIADLPALAAADHGLPAETAFTLGNGMDLTVYASPDRATESLSVLLPVGSTVTSGAELGLADLALKLDTRGAGDLSRQAFSAALEKSGADLSRNLADHRAAIVLTAPTSSFAAAVTLLSSAIREPRFTPEDWALEVSQAAQRLDDMASRPDAMAYMAAASAMFPGAPEGEERTAAVLRTLTMEQARALYARLFAPSGLRLIAVSNRPAAEIKAMMEAAFGGWTSSETPPTAPKPAQPRFTAQELRRDVPGATQAAIVLQMAAPSGESREAVAFQLAAHVLAGSSNNRLNKVLREEKGWSYGVSGSVAPADKGEDNAYLSISTTVQADHTQDAVTELRRLIGDLAAHPITQAEFDAARAELRSGLLSAFESTTNLTASVAGLALLGYGLDDLAARLKLLEGLTVADLQAQANIIAAATLTTVVAGDPARMK